MLSLTPGSYLCTYVFDFLTSFNDFFLLLVVERVIGVGFH